MTEERFHITWIGSGRTAQCAANPAHPDGIDVTIPHPPGQATCTTPLPYPARECGAHRIACRICGATVMVTAAGRRDDPRSLTVPCKATRHAH